MDRQIALIRLLADGEVHSGEAVAAHLGITRAAVWKALRKAAERFGLALESVRGRGYRLAQPLELLERERLLAAMSEQGRARLARLDIHDQIDSTNAWLMREAAAGAPSATLCLAEQQSAGRGRRGRTWVSPFGVNLYGSLLWRSPLAPAALGASSLVAGVVVAEQLAALGVEGVALKWPNDVLWERRKLAGLLLEVAGESQGPSHLVVGIGINLRMAADQGAAIDQPWVTLAEALPAEVEGVRNALAGRLAEALLEALADYERAGLAPFLARWERFDTLRGQPVALHLGERVIRGRYAGIESDGALRLETAEGVRRFQAGEVSLRPVAEEGR
ncbi:bifunctional biotin--[acetyl-CoA-carboxylase] ligase/biotin operon repressor BirA [Marichromatium sp. AB32]|uniref:bifunctional biotin--[acetyl-CoA-carboxylase] ligase/biotin operon repressor BirA n=1 Tax=Marichromatium sp. AB32 TaxID=2483363 RepID=UPI000F3E6404|nr:bifunctional biotin--[acetyl-CoA-carboxylase] ligase/biotin operon repressor BirA [Marichromatium sp. AB32]RNE94426.1 bifunctional biotin--[acetyl-CoA-carboxylase] ligase/biotin operon repressor BirA [Marichromatium sp. AB32]